MWKFLLIGSLLLSACSHTGRPSKEVKSFVKNWSELYKPLDQNYAKAFENYIVSVEKIYFDSGVKDKFKIYLDSLRNNSQILEQQKNALPELYHQKTGRTVASTDPGYEEFRTIQMTTLYHKLFSARELQIHDEVGDGVYQRLKSNYDNLTKNQAGTNYIFPF